MLKRNKNEIKSQIDETSLMRAVLNKRSCLIYLLSDETVEDIYVHSIEKLKADNQDIFLKSMIYYLKDTKVLTNEMRQRGYDIVNRLFFDKEYRNHDRAQLINEIKGLLNTMKVDDYLFYKNEYDSFYDVSGEDYSEKIAFDHKYVLEKEIKLNEFIYSLCCLQDDEYYDRFDDFVFSDGSIYFINYLLNTNKDLFDISIFKRRSFEMLATVKFVLIDTRKDLDDYKKRYKENKKIINKAKKI